MGLHEALRDACAERLDLRAQAPRLERLVLVEQRLHDDGVDRHEERRHEDEERAHVQREVPRAREHHDFDE